MKGMAIVSKIGVKGGDRLKGDWVAAADPKAKPDDRMVWKYEKGTFEKTADGKWVHKTGDTTKEYVEKLVKEDYIEIEAGKEIFRLSMDRATRRVVGGTAKDALALKGGWVDATLAKKEPDPKTPDPKPKTDAKFVEVAAIKRTGQQGNFAIAPSPDAKRVAMHFGALLDAPLAIVDFETRKTVQSWKLPSYADKVAWSLDGKLLAAATVSIELRAGKQSKVFVWDVKSGEQRAEFDFNGLPFSLAASADCSIVAAAGKTLESDGLLKVWDVGTKKEILSKTIPKAEVRVAMTADGKTLAVSGPGPAGNQMSFLELPSGKVLGSIKCGSEFVMSRDGATVVERVRSDTDVVINVWDTKTAAKGPRPIKTGKWHGDTMTLLDNDRLVALGGGQSREEVRVFDVKTLAEFDSFPVGKPQPKGITRGYVYVRATPDTSHLLTYGGDSIVRMWTTPFGPKTEAPMPKEKQP